MSKLKLYPIWSKIWQLLRSALENLLKATHQNKRKNVILQFCMPKMLSLLAICISTMYCSGIFQIYIVLLLTIRKTMVYVITGPLQSHTSYTAFINRFNTMPLVSLFQLHWLYLYLNSKKDILDIKSLNSNAKTGQF